MMKFKKNFKKKPTKELMIKITKKKKRIDTQILVTKRTVVNF